MSACPFCGYENHPRHDCKAKERAAQELIRLRDEVDGLRAERDEWKLKFEASCHTLGGEIERYRAGRDEARAQIKAAKAYLDELAAHDADFPANPLEISQWTRKGVDLIARANKVFS